MNGKTAKLLKRYARANKLPAKLFFPLWNALSHKAKGVFSDKMKQELGAKGD